MKMERLEKDRIFITSSWEEALRMASKRLELVRRLINQELAAWEALANEWKIPSKESYVSPFSGENV